MAYSLRADGLSDVHLPDGTTMPMALTPQQLQAMGHTEIAASAVRPPAPPMVAGPGGGDPRDLSSGAGVFGAPRSPQEENTATLRNLLSQVPQSHASAPTPQQTKFDVPVPASATQGVKLADPTGGGSGGKPAARGRADDGYGPIGDQIFAESVRGAGGGGGRSVLGLSNQKVKRTEYGAVPAELSADIAKRGDELEQTQQANLTDIHGQREQLQARRDAELTRQMDDVIDQRMTRQAINDRLQQLQTTRDQREQEVASMPAPDLHRYWGERGVASQISTAIAITLGGYVQGLRGGENVGLKMANDSIERWMQTEREKYERAAGTAKRADNQYGQALALYGTPEMAENDMRARAYAVRDAMLANQLDQIGNADAFAKGQEALQQGALQRQQLKAQAAQMAGERAIEETLTPRVVGGSGGGGGLLKGLKAVAEGRKAYTEAYGANPDPKAAADARERQVRMPDGSIKFVPAASGRKEVQTAIDGRTDIISKLERLHQMQKNSNLVTDMTARAEYDALAAAVKSQATVLAGQGAMSKGDEENITNGIPTSGMHMKDAAAALAQTIAGQRSSLNSTIRGNVYEDPDATTPYAASSSAPASAQDVE